MNLKERAEKLKVDVPAVFIALKDKDTPVLIKILAGITVIYALSPIDLIPDFIPIIGYLDDILIIPVLIAIIVKFIPHDVWDKSLSAAQNICKEGTPQKWYYAVPIVLIWILILIWLFLKLKA